MRFLIFLISNIFKVTKTDNEENYDKQLKPPLKMRKCDVIPTLLFYYARKCSLNINLLNEILKMPVNYLHREEIVYIYDIDDFFK